jgi:hypothetical protein
LTASDPGAFGVKQAQIELRLGMSLQGCHVPPLNGGARIAGHPGAGSVQNTQVILGDHMPLLRGLAIPMHGLDQVPGHAAVTAVVQDTQGKLRRGVASFSLRLPQAHRLVAVAGVELRQGDLIRADRTLFRADILTCLNRWKGGS